jgi:GAF domain-containing protein
MPRRDKIGGKAVKTRRPKASTRRNAPKSTQGLVSAAGCQKKEVERLTRERDELLQQQTATADVLKVISRSTFDLQAVLNTLTESAARLCRAERSAIRLVKQNLYHHVASYAFSPDFEERMQREPLKPGRGSIVGRVILDGHSIHLADAQADPDSELASRSRMAGIHTLLGVPLLREGMPIGVLILQRGIVDPFTTKEIELAETFADQAVIAIENTRLFEAEQHRTRELSEALEQQTATSEVLRFIAASSGDLQPVFDAMLRNATQICNAEFASLFRFENGKPLRLASLNVPSALTEFLSRGIPHVTPQNAFGRVIASRQQVHIDDYRADQAYLEGDPMAVAGVEHGGIRSLLIVPMIKDDEIVGAFGIFRQEVRPFSQKQIQLVNSFAAQAVIAIENARLLHELRDSLVRQTATSELLQVITSSPGNLAPVFSKMLENAARICEANFGTLVLEEEVDEGTFRVVAMHNAPPKWAEKRTGEPVFKPGPLNNVAIVKRTGRAQHIPDLKLDPSYLEGEPAAVAIADVGGARTLVVVPLLNKNKVIGVFGMYRQEVRPFTGEQIALLENFAAQAVIAIENARLLNDLNAVNQQLEERVADQVDEIERMGRLRRFLPPQVADLIVASGNEKQLESHRGEITALFCDLRGFTGFSESSDPEDVMTLLRDYHAAIGEIIIKYSGTLERYAGDGVMVIFNDPVPVENPASQAVLMALDMRNAIGRMIEKWRDLGHDLGFGIGIAHGFATLGTIGFEGRFDYAAIGTVSNVASRLCDEAKPGQILISPRVRQAVDNVVTVEPVGEFTLKGIRRPMMAHNVLARIVTN